MMATTVIEYAIKQGGFGLGWRAARFVAVYAMARALYMADDAWPEGISARLGLVAEVAPESLQTLWRRLEDYRTVFAGWPDPEDLCEHLDYARAEAVLSATVA